MTVNRYRGRSRTDRQADIADGIMRHIVGSKRVASVREAAQAARVPVAPKVPAVAKTAQAPPVGAPAAVAAPAPAGEKRRPLKISDTALAKARNMAPAPGRKRGQTIDQLAAAGSMFTPWEPPKGVLPAGVTAAQLAKDGGAKLAMDYAAEGLVAGQVGAVGAWAGDALNVSFAEGIGFLGYSYLAALTQRAEYRRISERLAMEMTRKWIKFHTVTTPDEYEAPGPEEEAPTPAGAPGVPADGEEAMASQQLDQAEADKERVRASIKRKKSLDKSRRIKELEDEMRRLRVKDCFFTIAEGDGWFGRYHLYIDTGADSATSDGRAELQTPIGNGRTSVSKAKINRRKKLKALRPIEPMWCYPAQYNSLDPLKPDWYNPEMWYVNGVTVHRSRLLRFVGREVPDILKPAYAFGGLSMSQMAKPYVDNWLRTRQAVCDLIESFSVSGVYTNLSGVLEEGNDEAFKRIDMFNVMRSNAGAFVLDKETEEFFNVSTPLGALDKLQAQAQEQMSSVSGIPLIVLLGITPTGLNASSEGELRAFYDTIQAMQESFFRDHLQTVIQFIMLSLWGEIDEEITFSFEPLWSMTDKELAETQKIEAETDGMLIDKGIITPEEARTRVANDPQSAYQELDPAEVPEPPAQPDAGGDDPFGGGDEGGGGGEGGEGSEADNPIGEDEWNEGDHPRADNGQFGSGGGGSTAPKSNGGSKSSTKPAATQSSLDMKSLKQVGKKLGSNEGGQYQDSSGNKFYVKKPASQAHVANEKAAARLYQLAGVQTLNYVDAGPDHVVTKWEQLDKNNIAHMSPAEKKAAAADFMVHAWLSNWDAAGTGGDNQGVRGGKPVTLDVGGSLRYRAQGGEKGKAFGNKVSEIDTMRDPKMSPDAARLFGKMTDDELAAAAARVTKIPDAQIRKAAGDDALADTLIARKKDIAQRFSIAMDGVHDDEAIMRAAMDAVGANEDELDEERAGDLAVSDVEKQDNEEQPGEEIDLATDDDEDDDEPTEVAPDVFAFDEANFDESKHPRGKDGKFAKGAGGGGGGKEGEEAKEGEKPKSKKEQIGAMLLAGTTPKELMQAMGWPSVSMPAQAASLGMKLEKKDGKYFGIKMTDDELKAAKEAAAAKKVEKYAPKNITETESFKKAEELNKQQAAPEKPKGIMLGGSLLPVPEGKPTTYAQWLGALAHEGQQGNKETAKLLFTDHPEFVKQFKELAKPAVLAKLKAQGVLPEDAPVKPKAPAATADEKKKAIKSTPVQPHLVPGDKPETETMKKQMQTSIDDFNNKWQGKEGLTDEQLNEKVADFKALVDGQAEMVKVEKKQKAEILKAEQEKAAWEAKKKQDEEKAALEAEFAKNPEMKTHYEAIESLFGGKGTSAGYVASAKAKLAASGYDKYMTPEEAVGVIAYTGSHYSGVNDQLRKGQMTVAQYKLQKSINAGLDKIPAFEGTTYRKASLTPEQFALYKPGMVVEERGFTSTSKKKSTWSGSHQYTVHGKSGRDVQPISNHPGEAEVLFKSGTRFYVEKVEGNHITLREL